MTTPHTPDHPPLAADDPRISEWLDGRLAPADAADVERAVKASPELVALVDDLLAIRGAMRSVPTDTVPPDFSDRIMAAIPSPLPLGEAGRRPGEGAPEAVSIPNTPSSPLPLGEAGRRPGEGAPEAVSSRSHRMPWMALIGALAAGILVTVVVNLPDDAEREVALAPSASNETAAKKVAEGETTVDTRREMRGLAVATERAGGERASVAQDDSSTVTNFGQTNRSLESLRGQGGGGAGFAADEFDAVAGAETKSSVAPAESLAKDLEAGETATRSDVRGRDYRAGDLAEESAAELQAAGAPLSSAAPLLADTAEPAFIAPVPAAAAVPAPAAPAPEATRSDRALAGRDTQAPASQVQAPGAFAGKLGLADADKQAGATAPSKRQASASQPTLRARGAVPVGVVVITVGRPSERRALEHLVEASGLEVLRGADRLELVGKEPAIDGFLIELEKAGLVPLGTAPRKQKADKQKADKQDGQGADRQDGRKAETQTGRDERSLVLRIVERKAKQGTAPVDEEKP